MARETVLITGASRGIGAACAKLFAENGYNVAVNYLNSRKNAAELCKEIKAAGGSVSMFKADVSKRAQVHDMVEKIEEEYGMIDVIVNNAGISQIKLFTDITDDDWQKMISVNLTGMYNCISEILPQMISRKSGSIVNISSIWGITGASCEVHYSAAKAGVIGLTKALASEVAPSGIRVNCVAPGAVDTEMNGGFTRDEIRAIEDEIPMGRLGGVFEIAETVLFLASDRASFITGQVISPNGGFC